MFSRPYGNLKINQPLTPTRVSAAFFESTTMTTFKVGAAVLSRTVQGHFAKQGFHKAGRDLLKKVATELGLSKDKYTIRSNLGGDGVVGEVCLHGETIYMQLAHDGFNGPKLMYRSCKGQKDYTGGRNQWGDPMDFTDEDRVEYLLSGIRAAAAIEQVALA